MRMMVMKRFMIPAAALVLFGGAYACQQADDAEARTPRASRQASQAAVAGESKAAVRYVTASEGNAARYRIREQLVGLDLPNDAVGETKNVSGVIAADASGKVIPAESKFTVDVSTLVSDKQRRDRFVGGRVLETEQFPTVTLVPTSIRGLTLPLPKSGAKSFELVGNLTVRGSTRPTTWKVTAQFQSDRMKGTAATAFTFDDFSIQQPRVPVVLSVADTIKLEIDFTMVPAPAK